MVILRTKPGRGRGHYLSTCCSISDFSATSGRRVGIIVIPDLAPYFVSFNWLVNTSVNGEYLKVFGLCPSASYAAYKKKLAKKNLSLNLFYCLRIIRSLLRPPLGAGRVQILLPSAASNPLILLAHVRFGFSRLLHGRRFSDRLACSNQPRYCLAALCSTLSAVRSL